MFDRCWKVNQYYKCTLRIKPQIASIEGGNVEPFIICSIKWRTLKGVHRLKYMRKLSTLLRLSI